MLLELVAGKRVYDPSKCAEETNLMQWVPNRVVILKGLCEILTLKGLSEILTPKGLCDLLNSKCGIRS